MDTGDSSFGNQEETFSDDDSQEEMFCDYGFQEEIFVDPGYLNCLEDSDDEVFTALGLRNDWFVPIQLSADDDSSVQAIDNDYDADVSTQLPDSYDDNVPAIVDDPAANLTGDELTAYLRTNRKCFVCHRPNLGRCIYCDDRLCVREFQCLNTHKLT
jgi:hypothetical protein